MANSATNLDLIASSQASKEVTANALFDALSPGAIFGRRAVSTTGLTWGYYGGAFVRADGSFITVANGTVALTASATNYVLQIDGVVSTTTSIPSGWPAGLASGTAMYSVVTGASAVISYSDVRIGGAGGGGSSYSPPLTTKGDIFAFGTSFTRLPVGANGYVLSANSGQATGLQWVQAPGLSTANTFTKAQSVSPSTLTDATSVSVDASLSNNFHLLIGGNRTLANPVNLVAGQVLNFRIQQDGTGGRTLAFDTAYKFAGASKTLSTGANKIDLISAYYDGTALLCNLAKDMT
jgi:hypothetical protein